MRSMFEMGNKIMASIIILATILAIFLPVFDLNIHFQDYLVHFVIFLIISGLLGLVIDNKMILFTSFGCAAALSLFLKNASNTSLKNPKPNDRDKITVAHINLSSITDIETVQNIIRDSTIDIISAQEYTPDWASILPFIMGEVYPYSFQDVRIDLYGKGIFSKLPINHPNLIESQGVPHMEIEIGVGKEIFTILSTYLIPALDTRSKELAKAQFVELGQYCAKEDKTRIIMGEFNQVYWSHDIITFRTKTGLLNSRRNVNPNTFKMPYNHIFYTPDVECYHFDELLDGSNEYIGSKSYLQLKSKKSKLK